MKYSLAASILVAGATAQSFDVASAINALTTQTQQLTTDVMAYTGGDGATIKSVSGTGYAQAHRLTNIRRTPPN